MTSVIERIRGRDERERQAFMVDVFLKAYRPILQADPDAWRGKFRKMAAAPFPFYRGSAALFYADMAEEDDPLAEGDTGRVWIQGDLHAENFGTYMNSAGVLVFDDNDFDEAYVGPFTWDVKRLVASLTLIGYQKALSDQEIALTIETCVRSYVDQVHRFASSESDQGFALTLSNTEGKLLDVIRSARLRTRVDLLAENTSIQDFDRRFTLNRSTSAIDAPTREKVVEGFGRYLQTIPRRKRFADQSYNIKDVVMRRGMGIGSAGLPSYNVLVEGPTQALENDIVIYLKQATPAAPSRTNTDPAISE